MKLTPRKPDDPTRQAFDRFNRAVDDLGATLAREAREHWRLLVVVWVVVVLVASIVEWA